jgi:hypothetical protein
MTRLVTLATFAAALAVGCGGDDGDDPEELSGFVTPTDITRAYTGGNGSWTEVGPADWSCLDTASEDVPTAVDVAVTGAVEDFQSGDAVPDAVVTLYTDTNLAGSGVETATADGDGAYAVTVPTGSGRVAFKVEHPDALPTYSLNQLFDPEEPAQTHDVNSVSQLTANALPAFIGVTRTPGLGVVAGSIVDCAGNEVGGAIATMSSVSGSPEHLAGAESYYFSAQSQSLPVRHQVQLATNTDGLFVVIELPAASAAFLQVWGFTGDQDPASDDLTLLAEISAPVLADAVITASLEPLRQ